MWPPTSGAQARTTKKRSTDPERITKELSKMMPIVAARLMSLADVQDRQRELAEEFAGGRRGHARRKARRAARSAGAPARAAATPAAPLLVTQRHHTAGTTPSRRSTPSTPARGATVPGTTLPGVRTESSTTVAVDDRLPVG